MTLSKLSIRLAAALCATLLCHPASAGPTHGFSVRMSGWPDSTADYAFAFPAFTFTNLSDSGITLTSLRINDGSANGLWDYATQESSSAGVAATLTEGDRLINVGWSSTIAYSFTGFGGGKFFEFRVDPDTLHSGTGNVVDARPFVFAGGTVQAGFSNGESITLTWNDPPFDSFDPLRLPNAPATDNRNIYYEMAWTVTEPDIHTVPLPDTMHLMAAGLMGLAAVRRRTTRPISRA